MGNISQYSGVEIALIRHQLLTCNAELKNKPKPNTGGSLEIKSEIGTPTEPKVLKKDDEFKVTLLIELTGTSKDSKEIAFSSSCKFEGDYRIVDCEKNGISTKDNIKLWSLAISQLHPLASQFVGDLALKMGFRNIRVPPIIIGDYSPLQTPKKTVPRKKAILKA